MLSRGLTRLPTALRPSLRWSSSIASTPIGEILVDTRAAARLVGVKSTDTSIIAMLGDQSDAKSSMLGALINKDLFAQSGMGTMRPMIITTTQVSGGQPYIRHGIHGEPIYDPVQIRAILHELNGNELRSEPAEVNYFSPHTFDAVYVDLPGLISVAGRNMPADYPRRIFEIAQPYIEGENIKLVAVSSAKDTALSLTYAKIVEAEQTHNVLMGYTKADLVLDERSRGDDDNFGRQRLMNILTDDEFQPGLGKVSVCCRSAKEISRGMTIDEKIEAEQEMFRRHQLTDEFNPGVEVGILKLRDRLANEQLHRVSESIPVLRADLEALRKQTLENQQMMKTLSQNQGQVRVISREMGDLVESIGRNSRQRVEYEKDVFGGVSVMVSGMVDATAMVHFPGLVTDHTPARKTGLRPDNFNSTAHLNRLRVISEALGQYDPTALTRFQDLTHHGNCITVCSEEELDDAYRVGLLKSITPAFYRAIMTEQSHQDRYRWMRSVGRMVDDMVFLHEIGSESREVILKEIVEFVNRSIPSSDADTDRLTRVFFEYILGKISERTSNERLVESINRMIMKHKRPLPDQTELSWQLMLLDHSKDHEHYKCKTGWFDQEEFPYYYPVFGGSYTLAFLEEMKRTLSNDIYAMIGENVSNPLITDTFEKSFEFFRKNNLDDEESEIVTKLAEITRLDGQLQKALDTIDANHGEREAMKQRAEETKTARRLRAAEAAQRTEQEREWSDKFGLSKEDRSRSTKYAPM